jgi:hypothetical protein
MNARSKVDREADWSANLPRLRKALDDVTRT